MANTQTNKQFLTHADSCDDRGGDDGQGHASRDGQVPPVTRRLLQLVVGMDLQQRSGKETVNAHLKHAGDKDDFLQGCSQDF